MLGIEEEIKKAKDGVMVTLSNIGEGIHGDYDKNDEDDVNLLRFYIYTDEGRSCDPDKGGWQEKDSWCTDLAADMPDDMLQKALDVIFDRVFDVLGNDPEASVRHIGQELSWLGERDL